MRYGDLADQKLHIGKCARDDIYIFIKTGALYRPVALVLERSPKRIRYVHSGHVFDLVEKVEEWKSPIGLSSTFLESVKYASNRSAIEHEESASEILKAVASHLSHASSYVKTRSWETDHPELDTRIVSRKNPYASSEEISHLLGMISSHSEDIELNSFASFS